MKKSEVIEAIALELDDINQNNYYDEQGSDWCAKLLLMRMVELGMLPSPPNPECINKDRLYNQCLWEPEND